MMRRVGMLVSFREKFKELLEETLIFSD